ncbi:4831_t:CDS:2, partial [Funneliformis geosporum]
PEVLRGQPYTLASDIYSFSIIIWEFKYGIPPFDNEAHDFQLSLNICKGKRPKIIKNIPQCYNNLMKKCWDMNPLKRPTASEIKRIIENWKENIIEEDFKKELKDDILDFYKADKIIKWKSSINLSVSKIINNELTLKFHLNPLIDTNFKSLAWINKKMLAFQISEGLNYLHNENILHRDLVNDIDDPVVLSIAIAKGAREATINNTPEDYEKLYKQCWDSEPGKRPTINIILENIKKFIIENLYQTCLDSNPEKEPTIYEVLEVSKTMGLLGLPFEELFQKYFDKCPNKAEINVNDNNISAEESFNSISEMQSDELDLDNIQSKSYSDLCL